MTDTLKHCGDNDVKLMLQVKHGDIEAYKTLYQNHLSSVVVYFKQFGKADGLSEDLAQIVFMRIWQKRKTFREDSTFQAFLNGFIRKVLHEHIRKLRKATELFKNISVSHVKTELSEPEAAYSCAELLKNIEAGKSKLPKKQRQAIELWLDRDISHKNAGEKANCSYNTYHQQLFAARNKIEQFLKK